VSKQVSLIFELCLLIVLVSACGVTKGFGGSAQDRAKVAIVRPHGVDFKSVNGISVGAGSTGLLILPGINEIELTINATNYHDTSDPRRVHKLVMTAEPGKEYAVTARRGDGRLCAFPLNTSGAPDFSAAAGCVEN